MGKRNLLTAVGILLSFAIAAGGWLLTSRLIDMESDRLLSGTTPFLTDTPGMESVDLSDNNGSHDLNIQLSLSEGEMVSILWQWDHGGLTRFHEPAVGQINMEQAIESGREGIRFLSDQGIFPEEALAFQNARAYLAQTVSDNEQLLPLEYSYWNVSFVNDYVDVFMTVHASTGQVWRMSAVVPQRDFETPLIAFHLSNDEIKTALSTFMENLGIRPDDESEHGIQFEVYEAANHLIPPEESGTMLAAADTIFAYQSFATGAAAATFTANGVLTTDGISDLTGFHFFLTLWREALDVPHDGLPWQDVPELLEIS